MSLTVRWYDLFDLHCSERSTCRYKKCKIHFPFKIQPHSSFPTQSITPKLNGTITYQPTAACPFHLEKLSKLLQSLAPIPPAPPSWGPISASSHHHLSPLYCALTHLYNHNPPCTESHGKTRLRFSTSSTCASHFCSATACTSSALICRCHSSIYPCSFAWSSADGTYSNQSDIKAVFSAMIVAF
jgi:hypothetical protein